MVRRLAAVTALLSLAAAAVLTVVALSSAVLVFIVALVAVVVVGVGGWFVVTTHGPGRVVGLVVVTVAVGALIAGLANRDVRWPSLVAIVVLIVVSVISARYALGRDRANLRATPPPGRPVGPARHGVLIINPRSGDGVADSVGLVEAARRRNIETLIFDSDDDLDELGRRAIADGADVIGMAGGDGSQALVAALAMEYDIAHVCIPAGTRNHFALDLGLDRDDVLGALDAFGPAHERRVDLAQVGDRVFVNNVSLGVYATIVQSSEYREAKVQTAITMLPELLGEDGSMPPMRFRGPDGETHDHAPLLLVANNAYTLTRLSGLGTRERLDGGELGVAAVEIGSAAEVAGFVAAEAAGQLARYRGFHEWTAPEFRVEADGPIEAGVDGEALVLESPLEFRSLPSALRVRIPNHAPGWSPASLAPPSVWWTVRALGRVLVGRPPALVEHLTAAVASPSRNRR